MSGSFREGKPGLPDTSGIGRGQPRETAAGLPVFILTP